MADKYNTQTKHINVYLFNSGGFRDSFSGDLQNDLRFIQIAIVLVVVYCIIFMGSCSPIHFRSLAALVTILCVGLAYTSSTGFSYLIGG